MVLTRPSPKVCASSTSGRTSIAPRRYSGRPAPCIARSAASAAAVKSTVSRMTWPLRGAASRHCSPSQSASLPATASPRISFSFGKP